MRKSFELLKVKEEKEFNNIYCLEKKNNICFPPSYKIFINNFLVGENGISYEMFYHPTFKDKRYLSYFTFSLKPEIDFSGFNSIEDSILFSKEIEDKDDIDYLTIGHCAIGGILLGLKGDKKDFIYYYDPDGYPNTHTKIADNIFNFVSALKEVMQPEEYLDGVKFYQLYKNWGDKTWRVKE
ncbi:hypothetical protein [Tenacibaculum sp. nBUS_03]|uniref:hypothetical protein n=1 Tax=Tenacibaculum sp. nBUS_03 TaxID=3395320 RepID=UPI003EB90AE1